MDFTVEFYETEAGKCPVREFLDELKARDPDDFAVVVVGLAKLRSRQLGATQTANNSEKNISPQRRRGDWFSQTRLRVLGASAVRRMEA
jgi:hypothetical protein